MPLQTLDDYHRLYDLLGAEETCPAATKGYEDVSFISAKALMQTV